MKFYNIILLGIVTTVFFMVSCNANNPNVPIYFYPPETIGASSAPNTGSSTSPDNGQQSAERNITVDQKNNVFSIGIPAGWEEQTQIVASKPVDYWFEYLSSDMKLIVNGKEVTRNPGIYETKIGYTKYVTGFTYQIANITGNAISYNLHLIPSDPSQSVQVIVHQKWVP
jgi:hypothetical protein